ncbi:hypothetical protein DFA_04194 [Cavenderia fasciculata]|uniref:Ankyrin repeat-containing protein n=1 Tax=Cavenderia fasciculata TaxID=261658 RepID=F4Q1J7_CACFS|nr:uncharacterized protein DFA_04194 [Cavenderia fasciculata]EGG18698.1 hypothetical protein DFA_04194 [Cavenderia fasciculata]|eukprot:XP_004366602.1 hypothetical protein DFA_04194 [Cavenderia fasciculata]
MNDYSRSTNHQPPATTTTTTAMMTTRVTLFKSLIGSTYIRQKIFKHVREIGISNMIYRGTSTSTTPLCGRDIIKLSHLEMISKYGMSRDFIKHYLPNKDQVLIKRRWYVISRYCSHPNATLDTLLHLLEWSPEYDPQDQVEYCHQDLVYNVASRGHRDILELLLKRYPNIINYIDRIQTYSPKRNTVLDIAAFNGYLSTIQLLSSIKQVKGATKAIDWASENGHYEVVIYLSQNRSEGCTTEAINWASRNGHLDIVKYLSSHRSEGCTTDAFDGAAERGQLHVLKWLHENRSEGGTSTAMDRACAYGYFEVVQWLYQNGYRECTTSAMDRAAENGHLNIIQYLNTNTTKGCTAYALNYAKNINIFQFLHENGKICTNQAMDNHALKGDLDIVKFIHFNCTEGGTEKCIINACKSGNIDLIKVCDMKEVCSTFAVDAAMQKNCSLEIIKYLDKECNLSGLSGAIKNGRLDIIQYLHQRFPKSPRIWTNSVLKVASRYGQLDIVKFLHENRTEKYNTNDMDLAAKYNHLDVVKVCRVFLHFNRTKGCSYKAIDWTSDIEVVKFLHFNRTEGCSTDAMDNAARNNNLELIKFLHQNRSEGCTDQALWGSKNHPDIYHYLLSNKIIPVELIKKGRPITIQYEEDCFEIIDLVNKYYCI